MDPEPTKEYVDANTAGVVNAIMLARIYDALIVLITIQDPKKAVQLTGMHANGDLLGPNPAYRPEPTEGVAGE